MVVVAEINIHLFELQEVYSQTFFSLESLVYQTKVSCYEFLLET